MGKINYWLAIVPLVAIWLIAIGSSFGQVFSLIDLVAHTQVSSAPSGSFTESIAVIEDLQPLVVQVPDRRPLRSPPPNVRAGTYNSQNPLTSGTLPEPYEEHMRGISDPRIRKLIIPAIED